MYIIVCIRQVHRAASRAKVKKNQNTLGLALVPCTKYKIQFSLHLAHTSTVSCKRFLLLRLSFIPPITAIINNSNRATSLK